MTPCTTALCGARPARPEKRHNAAARLAHDRPGLYKMDFSGIALQHDTLHVHGDAITSQGSSKKT